MSNFTERSFHDYRVFESNVVYWLVHNWNEIAGTLPNPKSGKRKKKNKIIIGSGIPTDLNGYHTEPEVDLPTLLSMGEAVFNKNSNIPDVIMLSLQRVITMRYNASLLYIASRTTNAREELAGNGPMWTVWGMHLYNEFYFQQLFWTLGSREWGELRTKHFGELGTLKRDWADVDDLKDVDSIMFATYVFPMEDLVAAMEVKDAPKKIASIADLAEGEKEIAQERYGESVRKGLEKMNKLVKEPVQKFRIIREPCGLDSEFFIACYCLYRQATEMRHVLRNTWRHVAEGTLPMAVAGILSRIAVSIVKGEDDALKLRSGGVGTGMFHVLETTLFDQNASEVPFYKLLCDFNSQPQLLEPSEIFMFETYMGLVDYITDIRSVKLEQKKTHSINDVLTDWDADSELESMESVVRRKWRHTYIVHWLYDFMSPFLDGMKEYLEEEQIQIEKLGEEEMRCIIEGPASKKRRLHGLNDFAVEIAKIIYGTTDPEQAIRFQHVFELQCILEAFLACRGRQSNDHRNHVFNVEKLCEDQPELIAKFLGSEDDKRGFRASFLELRSVFREEFTQHHGTTKLPLESLRLCEQIYPSFEVFGKTKTAKAESPAAMLPGPNGVWRLSPYLCANAMAETLAVGASVGMTILDRHTELFALMHLCNMLVRTGYLERAPCAYMLLANMLFNDVFPIGEPTENFCTGYIHTFELRSPHGGEEFLWGSHRCIDPENTNDSNVSKKRTREVKENNVYNLWKWSTLELLHPSLIQVFKDAKYNVDGIFVSHVPPNTYVRMHCHSNVQAKQANPLQKLLQVPPESVASATDVVEAALNLISDPRKGEKEEKGKGIGRNAPTRQGYPDVGNLLIGLRGDFMSPASWSSYFNYPRLLKEMFTMFRKLDDMLQQCEAGRSFRNLMLQDERAAQDKEGENRLLLTRYVLEYADRYAEYHPKEEKDGMLTEIAEVVQECFEGKEDDYFYPGLEPPELERCRQLHEHEQHVPQCQMS